MAKERKNGTWWKVLIGIIGILLTASVIFAGVFFRAGTDTNRLTNVESQAAENTTAIKGFHAKIEKKGEIDAGQNESIIGLQKDVGYIREKVDDFSKTQQDFIKEMRRELRYSRRGRDPNNY